MNYKIWCDQCNTWTDDFEPKKQEENETKTGVLCSACGNMLVLVELKNQGEK